MLFETSKCVHKFVNTMLIFTQTLTAVEWPKHKSLSFCNNLFCNNLKERKREGESERERVRKRDLGRGRERRGERGRRGERERERGRKCVCVCERERERARERERERERGVRKFVNVFKKVNRALTDDDVVTFFNSMKRDDDLEGLCHTTDYSLISGNSYQLGFPVFHRKARPF